MKNLGKTNIDTISIIQEGYIHSSTADIYYSSYGTGQPLILLHGNSGDSRFFKQQTDFFKQYFQVITIDSRGHGKSSHGTQDLSIKALADDVRNIIEHLGLQKVILLGFSDGGNVALQLSLESYENIQSLIIVSGNLHPKGLKSFVRIPIKLGYYICYSLRKIRWFGKMAQMLSLMANEPNMEPSQLSNIKIPVLVLAGEYDVIEKAHTKLISDSIPNAMLKIIEQARHFLLIKEHNKANQIILDFLQNIKD